ncbi:hypothetical protein O6H91_08G116700 [Diphasiastrum complanatum]|uniref:Uncharacterized protein n=1 Tax=Diphasiastrum complanatum TaxID=34168 RepID=A0ACC2D1I3_DIPCM|nr:hypothetical protein O6H91_08G116700 [Diphasiastrum complanatum]
MLGKRSRSMRRIASMVSVGLECAPIDTFPPAEQRKEKQSSLKCSLPCAPRVVIGFNPKACLDKEDEKKPLPVTPPSEKQSSSPKSRPTSGLESLLTSPRPAGNKNLQTVGLNFLAALDSDPELPKDGDSSKIGVAECGSMAPGIANGYAHIPPYSDLQQTQSSTVGNTFKQSHPIPIAQSPLLQPAAQYKLQHQNSSHSSQREPVRLNTQAPRKHTEGYVHGDGEVGRCVFSFLTTSPGTYEGADCVCLGSMDFMEACFLCKRHLGQGRDIYMYKGDKAFCSDECRYQQIVIDERAERREKYSSVALKTGTAVQSRRSNHKTRVLSASTAAAA